MLTDIVLSNLGPLPLAREDSSAIRTSIIICGSPARAGKTSLVTLQSFARGTTPLARRKRGGVPPRDRGRRTIPARAGKTRNQRYAVGCPVRTTRARAGERPWLRQPRHAAARATPAGVEGVLTYSAVCPASDHPARAGTTSRRRWARCTSTDHPGSRGDGYRQLGLDGGRVETIPARAGKTPVGWSPGCAWADHPRSRRED